MHYLPCEGNCQSRQQVYVVDFAIISQIFRDNTSRNSSSRIGGCPFSGFGFLLRATFFNAVPLVFKIFLTCVSKVSVNPAFCPIVPTVNNVRNKRTLSSKI